VAVTASNREGGGEREEEDDESDGWGPCVSKRGRDERLGGPRRIAVPEEKRAACEKEKKEKGKGKGDGLKGKGGGKGLGFWVSFFFFKTFFKPLNF
jgi:hypothetical protein